MAKASKRQDRQGPFAQLEKLLKNHPLARVSAATKNASAPAENQPTTQTGGDRDLFRMAMADVDPINRENVTETHFPPKHSWDHRDVEEEVLIQLKRLIQYGEGFEWQNTPEYIEGCGYINDRPLLRSLRRGDFSIQDHLDLHGMPVSNARAAFDAFLKEALRGGKRALLVIHGRGLSSPGEPVLKKKIQQWLRSSRWRRWLLAYTTARACDGGAGATYVLLRSRPLSRRQAKRQS
jgi:DNA-nicking Smr family endonuclease